VTKSTTKTTEMAKASPRSSYSRSSYNDSRVSEQVVEVRQGANGVNDVYKSNNYYDSEMGNSGKNTLNLN